VQQEIMMEQWQVFLILGLAIFPVSILAWLWCMSILARDYHSKDNLDFKYIDPSNSSYRYEENGEGLIKVHNLPSSNDECINQEYDSRRHMYELASSGFLITGSISCHFIVLAGFLVDKRMETMFATLGFSGVIGYLLLHSPLFYGLTNTNNSIVRTECFYEHVHETFIVVCFVFIGQSVLLAFLVYFVIANKDDVYDFQDTLDRTMIIHLIVAISVDYVRFNEVTVGLRPSRLSLMMDDDTSNGKLVLKEKESNYYYFIKPSNLEMRIRMGMHFMYEVTIPIFIFLIAPVLLTFTKSPIDVLLNILGLTFIALMDNSMGPAKYRIIDQ